MKCKVSSHLQNNAEILLPMYIDFMLNAETMLLSFVNSDCSWLACIFGMRSENIDSCFFSRYFIFITSFHDL